MAIYVHFNMATYTESSNIGLSKEMIRKHRVKNKAKETSLKSVPAPVSYSKNETNDCCSVTTEDVPPEHYR